VTNVPEHTLPVEITNWVVKFSLSVVMNAYSPDGGNDAVAPAFPLGPYVQSEPSQLASPVEMLWLHGVLWPRSMIAPASGPEEATKNVVVSVDWPLLKRVVSVQACCACGYGAPFLGYQNPPVPRCS
jgi:hypothetical protein